MYRNYFADTHGEVGQSAGNQLNNLGDLLEHVGPTAKDFLKVKNGCVLHVCIGTAVCSSVIIFLVFVVFVVECRDCRVCRV